MRKLSSLTLSSLALALGLAVSPAMAQSAGEYTVGVGAHVVSPKSDNGKLTTGQIPEITADAKPTLTFEYFVADNLGIELLLALPFEHKVSVQGTAGVTERVKVLPPTLSVQYHFENGSPITPFAGVGVNYTMFSTEGGALGYTSLSDSWGAAVHLGADLALNDATSLRIDARWIDISSDLKSSALGGKVGKVEIDPIVWGFAFVHKF